MSKISLEPNASGAGTFTLAAPNSNTNRTLTLPDESGKVLTDVSDIAAENLTGRVPAANVNLGGVIQVVSTFPTENFITTSSSLVDVAGYSLTITPTSATSKILISFGFRYGNSSSSNNGFQILRDSTALPLGSVTSRALGNVRDDVLFMDTNLVIEDTPNTTSAVTYKLQVQRSSGTLHINDRTSGGNNRHGYLILTEIAA